MAGNFANFTPTYSPSDPDCWWTYDKCDTPKLASLKPDVTGTPAPLSLGYGFDDGPNCSHNAFYDYLSQQNQKATMFYIGSNVMDWPLQAQRAIADGHEICVHTWSHHYMTAFESSAAFAELWYTMQAIKLVVGVTPKCWRPPFGDVDDRIRAIATALNLTTIVWQYDSNDWQVGAPGSTVTSQQVDQNYQNLITSAGNGTFNTAGTIMLTHELTNYTMQEAINWYPKLKAAFKSIVPVGVGMNWTQPYVETNYSLPAFSQYTAGQLTVSATATGASASSSSPGGSSKSSAGRTSIASIVAFGAAAAGVMVGVLSV
ncbi:carbohydrate esterase family 4 protein [Athelia psychrophila]|uniref:chitin deacetylase n=1 Tax=Athelia psychrophila TaxID=1759441 RepID=A0A166IRQ3_9AGAM|nr:carbohydrate esterase family 4 protein [Fibularhizoctonia sp. CBS 109695]